MASNSEIVISVQEESDPVDDETDEDDDNNESSKNPSDAASDSCVCDSYGVLLSRKSSRVEGEDRWEALTTPRVPPQNCGGTESKAIVTCMMPKSAVNDRRI
ncbi:hypothetical protein TNCV_2539601 [Trichonephila clavipes]|nr:hypothetical protein TNCV_2539601 [Trichonephila clavipes]